MTFLCPQSAQKMVNPCADINKHLFRDPFRNEQVSNCSGRFKVRRGAPGRCPGSHNIGLIRQEQCGEPRADGSVTAAALQGQEAGRGAHRAGRGSATKPRQLYDNEIHAAGARGGWRRVKERHERALSVEIATGRARAAPGCS